jgi:hypothetical protein|tara:strand:+ start:192 stop:350 length:159 start_codon:yes stop_codon:yes gene_type:complete
MKKLLSFFDEISHALRICRSSLLDIWKKRVAEKENDVKSREEQKIGRNYLRT